MWMPLCNYACACIHTCMHSCMCVRRYVCMAAYIHSFVHTYACVCTDTCVCVYVYWCAPMVNSVHLHIAIIYGGRADIATRGTSPQSHPFRSIGFVFILLLVLVVPIIDLVSNIGLTVVVSRLIDFHVRSSECGARWH